MTYDPSTPVALVISFLTQIIGPHAAGLIGVILGWVTFGCFVCSLICAKWPPPPAGTKLARVRSALALGALAFGFLRSAYQPGRTATMTPVDKVGEIRTQVAEQLGIPREATKP